MDSDSVNDVQEIKSASEPTSRVLRVLEFANTREDTPFTLQECAQVTAITKATLLRLLRTLVQDGYLANLGQRYQSNLFFSRRLSVSAEHMTAMDSTLAALAEEVGQSAEVLTGRIPNLYWFEKRDCSRSSMRVVARGGTTRSLYELDAPARLYLRELGINTVRQEMVPGFFHIGPEKRELSTEQALELIASVDPHGVEYDYEGNSNGVRRFVTIVRSATGAYQYLLSVAEPAIPQNSRTEHVSVVVQALADARGRLSEKE